MSGALTTEERHELLVTGENSDCMLICGSTRFAGHKGILSDCPRLHKVILLAYQDDTDHSGFEIMLPAEYHDVILPLVHFIYTHDVQYDLDIVTYIKLAALALSFELPTLHDKAQICFMLKMDVLLSSGRTPTKLRALETVMKLIFAADKEEDFTMGAFRGIVGSQLLPCHNLHLIPTATHSLHALYCDIPSFKKYIDQAITVAEVVQRTPFETRTPLKEFFRAQSPSKEVCGTSVVDWVSVVGSKNEGSGTD